MHFASLHICRTARRFVIGSDCRRSAQLRHDDKICQLQPRSSSINEIHSPHIQIQLRPCDGSLTRFLFYVSLFLVWLFHIVYAHYRTTPAHRDMATAASPRRMCLYINPYQIKNPPQEYKFSLTKSSGVIA